MHFPEFISILLILMAFFLIFPSMFGCLTILVLFGGFIFVILYLGLKFFALILLFFIYYPFKLINKFYSYHKIPTIDTYILNYPYTKISDEINCYKCQYTKFNNVGLFTTNSKNRYYMCKNCSSILFRFKVI